MLLLITFTAMTWRFFSTKMQFARIQYSMPEIPIEYLTGSLYVLTYSSKYLITTNIKIACASAVNLVIVVQKKIVCMTFHAKLYL